MDGDAVRGHLDQAAVALLALAEGLLAEPPLAHVDDHAAEPLGIALEVAHQGHRGLHVAPRAVLGDDLELGVLERAPRLPDLAEGVPHPARVLRVRERAGVDALELLA